MSTTALTGTTVIELAANGPLELAGMLLSDLGATVIRVLRPGQAPKPNVSLRGREHVTIDLKTDAGRKALLTLVADADVLLEAMRPGVAERLGIGPADAAAVNPRIVYGRMTGWGQDGPLASKAGHDINYIAETGALWAIRAPGSRPTIPLNAIGDYGGGALYLVNGVLAALLARQATGVGEVIDAAIVDGTASLLQGVRGFQSEGWWVDEPHSNMLDHGLPWYDTYECADGGWMAVGAIEPQFYRDLLTGLGLADAPDREDPANWLALRTAFAEAFRTRTRDEWVEVFADLDACTTPVLSLRESLDSPHLTARGTWYRDTDGWSAAPAPRFLPLTTSPED
ncbi:MAG TPA: CaiB/BaiF CoA-transferase family protein [Microbacteriaceae bacterium]|nr:CaiB/BaiF CoA-transferase family protein [Microbacteriaceae bacterium]